MNCAWQAYLNILPGWMRSEVNRLGEQSLQELRIRVDRAPELITTEGTYSLQDKVSPEDISYCINTVSQYSPWASTTIQNGYITAAGGHRVGICGDVAVVDGKIRTIKNVTSLCVRVARDFPGIGLRAAGIEESMLIIGAPGRGKSTLLRDLIRQKSNYGSVAVVDERKELFPAVGTSFCFPPGQSTDVMSGCSKSSGMQMVIRTMNPRWIAVDEITETEDCQGLIHAAWCGVRLLAAAHAENISDFLNRPVYKSLISSGIFKNVIVMQSDKSWILERLNL